jgi:hypothetical protein
MKKFLFLIMLLSAHLCRAQNWQCLQPGVKHYFTNSNRYLRGIRIDSVKTYADSVVYYPFHTPRGRYYNGSSTALDSTGGSWLGKHVVQLGDGTFLFDNLWGDTIIIKSQASVGDSWVFCRDTSSLYYRADLVAKDTMTVLGYLDSIKTLLLTARNGSAIVTTDPVDSFRIVLSKNYGFVQVCDLYTFPYHKPDSGYVSGLDLFLDKSGTMPYQAYGFAGYPPTQATSLFALTPFVNPTLQQLYTFSIGDVLQYKQCHDPDGFGCDISYMGSDLVPSTYEADTIINIISTGSSVRYDFSGGATYPSPFFIYYTTSREMTIGNSLLIDTTLMPEEYLQPDIVYYSPFDTSYCMNTPFYDVVPNYLRGIQPPIYFEGPVTEQRYKTGIGQVYNYFSAATMWFTFTISELVYYKNASNSCGSFHSPSAVPEIKNRSNYFSLFPNPANDLLTIKLTTQQPYTINLINTLSQTIKTIACNKLQQAINTANIPAGVYTISITDENGNRYNEKVVIVH